MAELQRVLVRVPASSANLGPGFDCLGLALDRFSDYDVQILPGRPAGTLAVRIVPAWGDDPAFARLPADHRNLAYRAFATRWQQLGREVPAVRLTATLGVPPGRGLGSSAGAVVAGILAADALAGHQAARADLVGVAAALECGGHADNVAAALLGGLAVVARDGDGWRAVRAAYPDQLRAVLFVPAFPMDTAAGRALLPASYPRADATHNVGHAALLLAALAAGDLAALSAAMDDRFHEPYRAQLFPQLPDLLAAARQAGAYGACLSGGGSAILALATAQAESVAAALVRAAAALHIEGRVVIAAVCPDGAAVSFPDDPFPARLVCPEGHTAGDLRATDYRCACGAPLDIALGDRGAEVSGAEWRRRFDARLLSRDPMDRSGVWRFREVLLPDAAIQPVARPEGGTNLYPAGREQGAGGHGAIGAFAGLDRLWLKHEGENPTGSFKDRGMTVGVSVARWLGASAVACASTGNTSASMAAYAAQAGLRAIVLLPAGKVATGKLAQALAYGAEIRPVAGDFDQAMADVERLCRAEGIYLLNSLNPYRILGQQSLAFELAQQFGWDAPDWIVLPAGNLGNTSALGAGLLRAQRLGLIPRLPRIAAIQAAGADPFYRSYLDGFASCAPVQAQTIATAINIGDPVSFLRARAVIRATNGVVAHVSDDEILCAKAIIDRAGIGCEPASAAAVAGARQLVAAGVIRADERVVCVLTGNLLKDPDAVPLAQAALRAEARA